MLVKYLLNWFTILFLSVQQFPSDVIHLSFIFVFLFLDFKTSLIVLHAFLQSFLNISNLFLKYNFLDSLINYASAYFCIFYKSANFLLLDYIYKFCIGGFFLYMMLKYL